MLKKLLTTFIVLAATATAWAEGYGYTLDKDGARATITTGEQTLEEVIADIKGLTPTVQYIILPDGMKKAEVNSIATANGFVVAVSKNEATKTEAKWVYTYNGEEFIYEGTPTTTDGVSTANVKVLVDLTETKFSYTLWGQPYNGTVFFDAEGNCYGVQNAGDVFDLTKKQGYTYNNGTTEYTGKVAEADGKYYGVINPTKEVTLDLSHPVSWTYDNGKYAYFGEVYNNYGNNIFWQGGTEYPLTTETRYTYDEYGQKKLYTGATRTDTNGNIYGNTGTSFNVSYVKNAYTYENGTKVYTGGTRTVNGKTYGNTGSGEVILTPKEAYTYNDNGIKVYTGATRTDADGKIYGNTGEMSPLTTTTTAPWTYDNGKYIYEGEYVSGTNGNVSGTFYELTKVTATEGNPVYTYIDYSTWPHTLFLYLASDVDENGKVNGQETTKNTSGDFYYYTKDNKKYRYNSVIYTKRDGTGQYACEGGTVVNNVAQAAENVKYYTDTDNKKVVYTGNIYTDNNNKEYGVKDINSDKELTYGTVYYNGEVLFTDNVYIKDGNNVGYTTNSYEITLEQKNVYVKDDNVTVYSYNVYTKDGKSVGFENGTEHQLIYGEVKLYTKDEQTVIAKDNTRISLDGDTYCEGGNAYNLMQKEEGYTANLYTDSEGKSVIYTGKVYDIATGYIGGNEIELAYGDIYFNGENIYTGHRNADNTKGCQNAQNLDALFTYTYTNPNNGETVEVTDAHHLTTKEVDYTATVEQKEMEIATGKIHLIAYVSTPGSLYYAIGDKRFGGADLTAVTLSGSLNAADIASHDGMRLTGNGHAKYKTYPSAGQETDNDPIVPADDNAMPGTYPTFANITLLTYIDFSDAVFNVQTDMQINNMAHSVNGLKTVFLPTNEKMTEIPAHCLWGANGIEEICIPYNYEKIGAEAFYNTSISHFYTTDAAGNTITNGPNTMTFSENLRIIETSDSHEPTFSGAGANKITDVYVMRYNPEDAEYPTTHCQTKAFQASMLYGNNGNLGDMAHPIQRSNYINQGMWFAVLHYPQDIEEEYEKMYTDITRVYTLKDETGLVDGKGKAYEWPTHGQLGQAYTTVVEKKTNFEGTAYDQEFLAKHSGWLEFVLTGKSNTRDYDPQTENTEFVYRDWLAICVPYDLKKSQLLSILGVDPRVSEGGVDEVTTLKNEVITTTTPLYPDVRALTHVSRSVNNGKMILHFAKLVEQDGESVKFYDVEISKMNGVENEHGQGFTRTELTDDDPVVMKGGHPYLIRAYVPAAWNDKIKNLGMYIMSAASSANHAAMVAGKEEPYKYGACTVQADGGDMYLPCLKHKVHAFDADAGLGTDVTKAIVGEGSSHFVYNTGNDDPALYHFVGTYYDTKIPQYAYYIGKATDGHKFTRSTRPLESAYTWAPYTAVIVGLANPEYKDLNDHAANKTDELKNIVPEVNNGNDLVILAHEAGKYNKQAGARLSLGGFSDSTITGIVEIETDTVVRINDNKVYSINGQYMGTSLNNLPKGIYIINGQKKVVK